MAFIFGKELPRVIMHTGGDVLCNLLDLTDQKYVTKGILCIPRIRGQYWSYFINVTCR